MKVEIRRKKAAAKRIQDTFRWKRRQRFLLRLVRSNIPLSTVIKGVEKTKRKDRKRTTRKTTKKKEIDPTRWIECWDKVANATFYYHLDEDLSVRSSIVSVLPYGFWLFIVLNVYVVDRKTETEKIARYTSQFYILPRPKKKWRSCRI